MAIELVRYYDGKPVLQDRLKPDRVPIMCPICGAEYRLHMTEGEFKPDHLMRLRVACHYLVARSHIEYSQHNASLRVLHPMSARSRPN